VPLRLHPSTVHMKALSSFTEDTMRRYEQVSGAFFSLLAVVQLARLVMRWPVDVAGVSIPLWASVVAVVITTSFAAWAFRTAAAPQEASTLH